MNSNQQELYAMAFVDEHSPALRVYAELTELPSRLNDYELITWYNDHIDELPLPKLNDCEANRIRIARHALTSACNVLADAALSQGAAL